MITASFPFDYLKNCTNCNICSRVSVDSIHAFEITNVCMDTITVLNPDNCDLTTLVGNKIFLFKDEFNEFAHSFTVAEVSSNQIVVDLDSVSYVESGLTTSGWHIDNTLSASIIDGHITNATPPSMPGTYKVDGPLIGTWSTYKLTPTFHITGRIIGGSGNIYPNAEIRCYFWNPSYSGYASQPYKIGTAYGEMDITTNYCPPPAPSDPGVQDYPHPIYISFELYYYAWYKDFPVTFDFRIELTSLVDCKGNDRLGDFPFKSLYNGTEWYGHVRTTGDLPSASLTSTCRQTPDPDTGGIGTLGFYKSTDYSYTTPYLYIDYLISCEDKSITYTPELTSINGTIFYVIYYTDDAGTIHTVLLNPGGVLTSTTLPYDYKKNCQ